MISAGVRLSAVLLTWNSRKWLALCLSSLIDGMPADSEIVVIDNGSIDGTWEELRQRYPAVVAIKNERNRGVARARNQGIALSRGRFILFLDIDTVVNPGAIRKLLECAESNPGIGLVAPALVSSDGRLQPSCRRFPTFLSKIQRVIGPRRDGRNEDEYAEMEDWAGPTEVDYAIGACQLIRRDAVEQVGLLDERIFYGPEDADYCLRLALAGWRIVCLPTATVVHWEQRLTRRRLTRVTWHHLFGLIYYFLKHRYIASREKIYRQIEATRHQRVLGVGVD